MADLNFPSSPTLYQQYTLNGQTFVWDGKKWKFTSSSVVSIAAGTAITIINSLTTTEQFFTIGSSGSSFNISSSGSTHTFNIPIAGVASTGLVSTLAQTFTGAKTFDSITTISNTTASTATNNGALIISGGVGIGNSLNLSGNLNFWNPANSYYTSIKSGITTASTIYTLPPYYPSFGQSVLSADTNGNLSWVQVSANAGQGTVATGLQYQIAGYYPGTGASVSGSSTFTNNLATNTVFINHTTASTATTNGALVVSGGVGISGQLSYNTALIGTTGVSSTPSMTFIGTNGDPIKLRVLDDSTLAFSGSQGQLFSISPVLNTGYIFSVNDISGVPLLRANADATVSMAEYAGNVGIGLSNPAFKLQVLGNAGISGTTFISNTSSSISTNSGALTVLGGVGIGGSLNVSGASNISSVILNSGIIYGTLVGSATSAGFATTSSYSHQSGYAITSGSAITSGLATTASNVNVISALSNASHPILFTPSAGTASGAAVSSEPSFVYNPSTDILSVSGLAVTSTTLSTNSTSGALIVTGGLGVGSTSYFRTDVNVGNSTQGRLYFSQATLGSAGTTVIPSMAFIGTTNSPITLSVLPDNSLSFDGSSGQLFSINNNLSTGWIFSINDISGLPIFRANADLTVAMGEYGGNIGIGLSNPSYKLHVAGDTNLSSGYVYRINGTSVLTSTSLGTGITNSNLTAVGIISTGTWAGSTITSLYGGTGIAPSFTVGDILYANTSTTWGRLSANSNSGYVLASAGSGATPTYIAPSSLSVGLATTANYSHQSGYATTSGFASTSGFATTADYSHNSGYGITAGYATTSGFAVSSTYSSNLIIAQDTTNTLRRIIYSTNGVGTTSLYNTSTLFTNPSISSIGASTYTGLGYINIRPGLDANSGVSIGNSSGTPYVYFDTINNRVGINTANPLYDLHIIGEISATNKSFVINHPTKPNMSLRYGSLEGPENGVYIRGELKNQTKIYLPEYWTNLVDKDSISVNLTPIGRFSQLYVEKIEDNIVYVADCLMNPVHCYFTVFGERKDIPKLDVEY